MPKNAIYFSDDDKRNSIHFFEHNESGEIIISKNDKMCIRGDKLYFKYNDIDIYTELDNVICIDTDNDIIKIMRYKELSPPDEREYLVLLSYYDESISNTYQGVVGRQNVFDYIKSIVEDIDINKSIILAETVEFRNAISIYDFMKECILSESVKNDDGFDIEEYNLEIEE